MRRGEVDKADRLRFARSRMSSIEAWDVLYRADPSNEALDLPLGYVTRVYSTVLPRDTFVAAVFGQRQWPYRQSWVEAALDFLEYLISDDGERRIAHAMFMVQAFGECEND